MRREFIPAEKAYRKLHLAEKSNASVYLYGATGYGKTRLIQEYTGEKSAIWLSPQEPEWDLSPLDARRPKDSVTCVVVDDMQLLRQEQQKQILLSLARRDDIWLIMLGRMQTPLWLVPLITEGYLMVISEENLHLTPKEIRKIGNMEHVPITNEWAQTLSVNSRGNAYVIMAMIHLMRAGEAPSDDLQNKIFDVFISHLENNVIPQWDVRLQEFLIQVSVVDSFTLPLAVMITGDNCASAMLEQALAAGNFLRRDGDTYHLRSVLVQALRSRAMKVFGVQKYNQYINNAGLYYEMQGDYLTAIRLYEQSGNQNSMRNLLIRNARQHPGASNLYLMRRYYLALDDSFIETSPMLMSAMSMLYSIMLNPEQSEYWYQKLRTYAGSVKGGERREAEEQLLYLEIGLPHRGNLNMVDILKHTASLLRSGGLNLPELSVTNNQPSTMNGGKDFCEWSKRDQLLADTIGKATEKLLGPFGRGLVHAALCESFYEKGGRDKEVMHHAIMVQMETDGGGKPELLFAAIGIQVRLSLLSGNPANALRLLDSFRERVQKEKLDHLLPNISALRCRIALAQGDMETVGEWMQSAPNEQTEFWSLDRYAYLTKVRCYLTMGQNQDAINLLERLLYYAEVNKRTYIRMEGRLLMAMALRQEQQEWQSVFMDALNEIQSYGFVRIVSEKGAGVFPLLKELQKAYLAQPKADKAWFTQTLKETQSVAERYPGYLVCDAVKACDFCDTALTILRMQSEGFLIKDIAQRLDISERTVKYHAAENYRKLGAKGKTDAVQIAQSLHLL